MLSSATTSPTLTNKTVIPPTHPHPLIDLEEQAEDMALDTGPVTNESLWTPPPTHTYGRIFSLFSFCSWHRNFSNFVSPNSVPNLKRVLPCTWQIVWVAITGHRAADRPCPWPRQSW